VLHEAPQGKSAPRRWPRSTPHPRADTRGGGSRVRTVCETVQRIQTRRRSRIRRLGQPGRSRHDGRRPDRCSCRPARHGMVAVSVERVKARRAPQGVSRASFPPVLEPARQCPSDDTRTSEIGDGYGEGCSSRRGAGGPLREAPRGAGSRRAKSGSLAVDAKATPPSSKPWTGRSKLASANS